MNTLWSQRLRLSLIGVALLAAPAAPVLAADFPARDVTW